MNLARFAKSIHASSAISHTVNMARFAMSARYHLELARFTLRYTPRNISKTSYSMPCFRKILRYLQHLFYQVINTTYALVCSWDEIFKNPLVRSGTYLRKIKAQPGTTTTFIVYYFHNCNSWAAPTASFNYLDVTHRRHLRSILNIK